MAAVFKRGYIMTTEKLYYEDSHLKEFKATVLNCKKADERYQVILDRTAFFPEGGGQAADTGTIENFNVSDVQEVDSSIIHFVDGPLEAGDEVACSINWDQRFRRMQGHSGEHIVSGLIHKNFGCNNVGFHMGHETITIDFDQFLDSKQLKDIEYNANKAIWENHPVSTEILSGESLKAREYRSKLDLDENVRIVTIQDVDVCACCAPHVNSTGEIGLIKIISSIHHNDGVRIEMLAGEDAFIFSDKLFENSKKISHMLSSKIEETDIYVQSVLNNIDTAKQTYIGLSREFVDLKLSTINSKDHVITYFNTFLTDTQCRDFINGCCDKYSDVVAAVFTKSSEDSYKFILGSHMYDLQIICKDLNDKLNGRGGGSKTMVQGTVSASKAAILEFMRTLH